jgi:hypothetical protein
MYIERLSLAFRGLSDEDDDTDGTKLDDNDGGLEDIEDDLEDEAIEDAAE